MFDSWIFWSVIVALIVLCPPRWDPAIRWKESGYNWKKFKEIYGRK